MKTLRISGTRLILKNQRGMSFVKVLAAMVILTIGIFGIAPMLVVSISANGFADDVVNVASAAQNRLEEMIGEHSFVAIPYVDRARFDNNKYEVTSVVLDNSADPAIPENVYEIDVTVNWTDHSGTNRTMTFSTYASKY